MKSFTKLAFAGLLCSALALSACGSVPGTGSDSSGNSGSNNTNNPNNPAAGTPVDATVVFTPVGEVIDSGLIDLEFLPGQNGESIAITQDGYVYYLDQNFAVVGTPFFIDTKFDGNERGLLDVAADPLYNSNGLVYFYLTDPAAGNDVNKVVRYHVDVNVAGNTFSLSDARLIIDFPKDSTNNRHNGGSLVFMTQDELAIGVGDGANNSALAQDLNSRLGKIHRVIPVRTPGVGGFTDPGNGVSGTHPSIYSRGLRNPFTIILDGEGDLFVGDVGAATYEEINCVYYANENYWWPNCEGPCNLDPINPIHGYFHNDTDFDPDFTVGPKVIILSALYLGDQYGGILNNKIIYNDFYDGFVRLLTMNAFEQVIADQHLGNQPGLTGLHENPADGLLYGVSLFDSDRILRLDLAP